MALHWFTTYLTDYYSRNKKIGLDIGCGKQPYKEIYNCQYIGIDIPSGQMKNIKKKPDCLGSGEDLPFKDDTFDFISSFSVIPYVKNIEKFLNEMHRVTKNNGIAIITIMNLRALTRDSTTYYPNRFSSKQLEKKLAKHGFKSIKSKNLKALIWSMYFNLTSVYSYAIVKCIKNSNSEANTNTPTLKPNLKTRQLLRSKVIKKPKLYSSSKYIYRKYCTATQYLHTLPDFLIIGAAKCGTSSLYEYLIQHPSVGSSLTKQIHFFDRYYDRGVSWYKVCFPFKWQRRISGEATAHYMTHPLAAERAFKLVPKAKIIVMLRNPIDRAYSHYKMEYRNKNENLSFEDAIAQEENRINGEFEKMLNNENNNGVNYPHRAYVKCGEYLEQIKRWAKFYSKEQILIIKSEDFFDNPEKITNQVFKFLDLPPFKLKEYQVIRKGNYNNMSPNTQKKLQEYFKLHNERLYQFLGRNFNWS
ncbi:MAG TPA: sulfotransferase domain-containing protein [Nitrosopumilaceae archaeon]|nr:sulfotransferase domain-containing protein [Nitrosopumilaceae archaeon]